jgi:hypothetical protein
MIACGLAVPGIGGDACLSDFTAMAADSAIPTIPYLAGQRSSAMLI